MDSLTVKIIYSHKRLRQTQIIEREKLRDAQLKFDLGREYYLRPADENFSKIMHLDGLDILYQLCFNLYKCKSESFVLVSNLCGEKIRIIRL